MSKSDAMLEGLIRLGVYYTDLQPGWFDVVEAALSEGGYYIAPITPATTIQSRSTDPRTSAKAEPSPIRANTQRHLLLESYTKDAAGRQNGLTDEQAMELAVGVRHDSEYAKRCSELRAAGLIIDTGKDRPGNAGTDRIVCQITELGRAELARVGHSS